jgi:hypothetical protein
VKYRNPKANKSVSGNELYIHNELTHTALGVSDDARRKREKITHHGSVVQETESMIDFRTRAAIEDDEDFSYSLGDDLLPLDPDEFEFSGTQSGGRKKIYSAVRQVSKLHSGLAD